MTSPEITDAMVEAAEAVFYKTQGDMRAALSAALAAGAPMSRVKPLEWRTRYFDAEVTIEQASAGTLYQIRDYKGRFWLDIGPDDVGYATLEAAKAVAQADYEARILSALEPAPSALVAEPGEPTLPPCPFCGGMNLKSGGDDKIIGTWCLTCEASGPNEYGKFSWYHRNAPPALAQSAAPVQPEKPTFADLHRAAIASATALPNGYASPVQPEPPAWEWLHTHGLTGADMWLDTEVWMGRRSAVRRPRAGGPVQPDGDPYDRGRRDILNALLSPNPAIAAKIAKWAEPPRDPDPEGRMPFDVALWITEVAEQLGIKSREELAEASPVQQAAPSGEGE